MRWCEDSPVEVQVPHLLEFFRFCSSVERIELEQVWISSLSHAPEGPPSFLVGIQETGEWWAVL